MYTVSGATDLLGAGTDEMTDRAGARPGFRPSGDERAIRVAHWRHAEELAVWHMRHVLGFPEATATRNGADGGLDVASPQAVAQVKHYAHPVGAPEVQQAKGAGHAAQAVLFYALTGYTPAAREYAAAANVALFEFNMYADVVPANAHAARLVSVAEADSGTASTSVDRHDLAARRDAAAAAREREAREGYHEDRELIAQDDRDVQEFTQQFRPSRPWTTEEERDLRVFVLLAATAILRNLLSGTVPSEWTPTTPVEVALVERTTDAITDDVISTLAAAVGDVDWPTLMVRLHEWNRAALELQVAPPGDPDRRVETAKYLSEVLVENSVPQWWDANGRYCLAREAVHRRWEGFPVPDRAERLLDSAPFGFTADQVREAWAYCLTDEFYYFWRD